jgi:hypothetical protein
VAGAWRTMTPRRTSLSAGGERVCCPQGPQGKRCICPWWDNRPSPATDPLAALHILTQNVCADKSCDRRAGGG